MNWFSRVKAGGIPLSGKTKNGSFAISCVQASENASIFAFAGILDLELMTGILAAGDALVKEYRQEAQPEKLHFFVELSNVGHVTRRGRLAAQKSWQQWADTTDAYLLGMNWAVRMAAQAIQTMSSGVDFFPVKSLEEALEKAAAADARRRKNATVKPLVPSEYESHAQRLWDRQGMVERFGDGQYWTLRRDNWTFVEENWRADFWVLDGNCVVKELSGNLSEESAKRYNEMFDTVIREAGLEGHDIFHIDNVLALTGASRRGRTIASSYYDERENIFKKIAIVIGANMAMIFKGFQAVGKFGDWIACTSQNQAVKAIMTAKGQKSSSDAPQQTTKSKIAGDIVIPKKSAAKDALIMRLWHENQRQQREQEAFLHEVRDRLGAVISEETLAKDMFSPVAEDDSRAGADILRSFDVIYHDMREMLWASEQHSH